MTWRMNQQLTTSWLRRGLASGLLALSFAGWMIADVQRVTSELTVHEWGTFTAIAGRDGRAMAWMPSISPDDLPGFVEHSSDAAPKSGLRGTIRMETPVLYFYSPHELSVSVKARFTKGVITEWYPRAAKVRPSGGLRNTDLSQLETDGSIAWNDVAVSPNLGGAFPREAVANRYYAARETASAPLRVQTAAGVQQEKFLFYRGVSAAALPLSATQEADGRVLVRNLSPEKIPAVILFERRGERVGYRLVQSSAAETELDPPSLNDSVDGLCGDLERILVAQGLYPDEAHAMVETWRDSWFEEGSRLIYMVPRGFVDRILPLTINPTPGKVVRVFVGRLEIITPATAHAIETAVAANDDATMAKYGRFLPPILEVIRQQHAESAVAGQDVR